MKVPSSPPGRLCTSTPITLCFLLRGRKWEMHFSLWEVPFSVGNWKNSPHRWLPGECWNSFTGDSPVFSPILLIHFNRSFTGETVKKGSPVFHWLTIEEFPTLVTFIMFYSRMKKKSLKRHRRRRRGKWLHRERSRPHREMSRRRLGEINKIWITVDTWYDIKFGIIYSNRVGGNIQNVWL